ncbi:MAG: hypothetical protein M3Z32_05495 [Acidobacteriota bacterium]|nr:hypothetical protein [Acidobacteriota bacterium]
MTCDPSGFCTSMGCVSIVVVCCSVKRNSFGLINVVFEIFILVESLVPP